jgi:hypothetical protein
MKDYNRIKLLINKSRELGLSEKDINNSQELFENREYGLSFDLIVTQIYEYDLSIDEDFYLLVEQIAEDMEIPEEQYVFLKELI